MKEQTYQNEKIEYVVKQDVLDLMDRLISGARKSARTWETLQAKSDFKPVENQALYWKHAVCALKWARDHIERMKAIGT